MKKYCFTITSLLVLVMGITSCSDEENKTQTQVASRPTVPIMANELQIGTQIWMTKNLNVSRYRNGDPIPQVTNPTQWSNLTTGAWCYYANNTANGIVYGKLYNWFAVNDPRGLAPVGWHVPSDDEWTALTTCLGGVPVAGGKMKTTRTWSLPNVGATNSSGFSGVGAGERANNGGGFYFIGDTSRFWSSTSSGPTINYAAWSLSIYAAYQVTSRNDAIVQDGMSVRCIKD
ncbi:fibrobacter succinogenes major paralogous domain-containing protein [Flavobacterium sp.]|uniref:fibrobacter succinogenes major paralogous domain-containing protein n=1 Tax=Flavobacterium sp. TaxID=239 RepID=UPI00286B2DBB|nr:fibrobacter succinogenes major paralogous domain-containing protein [Flavobacterium sp.]